MAPSDSLRRRGVSRVVVLAFSASFLCGLVFNWLEAHDELTPAVEGGGLGLESKPRRGARVVPGATATRPFDGLGRGASAGALPAPGVWIVSHLSAGPPSAATTPSVAVEQDAPDTARQLLLATLGGVAVGPKAALASPRTPQAPGWPLLQLLIASDDPQLNAYSGIYIAAAAVKLPGSDVRRGLAGLARETPFMISVAVGGEEGVAGFAISWGALVLFRPHLQRCAGTTTLGAGLDCLARATGIERVTTQLAHLIRGTADSTLSALLDVVAYSAADAGDWLHAPAPRAHSAVRPTGSASTLIAMWVCSAPQFLPAARCQQPLLQPAPSAVQSYQPDPPVVGCVAGNGKPADAAGAPKAMAAIRDARGIDPDLAIHPNAVFTVLDESHPGGSVWLAAELLLRSLRAVGSDATLIALRVTLTARRRRGFVR